MTPPLKEVESARTDASKLKYLIKKLSRQRKNILLLAEKARSSPDKKRKQLNKIATEIRREKHSAKHFYKDFTNEIDEEIQLRVNYQNITGKKMAFENFFHQKK